MGFEKFKIKIDGETIEYDSSKELEITDVSEAMDKVAAQMAYWGHVWAVAEEKKELAKAVYENWKAATGEAVMASEKKAPEWKVKQKLEADPGNLNCKKSLAQATKMVVLCKSVFDSFKVKANMLQSKGAMMRAELDSTSMTTKSLTTDLQNDKYGPVDLDKKERVKVILEKK